MPGEDAPIPTAPSHEHSAKVLRQTTQRENDPSGIIGVLKGADERSAEFAAEQKKQAENKAKWDKIRAAIREKYGKDATEAIVTQNMPLIHAMIDSIPAVRAIVGDVKPSDLATLITRANRGIPVPPLPGAPVVPYDEDIVENVPQIKLQDLSAEEQKDLLARRAEERKEDVSSELDSLAPTVAASLAPTLVGDPATEEKALITLTPKQRQWAIEKALDKSTANLAQISNDTIKALTKHVKQKTFDDTYGDHKNTSKVSWLLDNNPGFQRLVRSKTLNEKNAKKLLVSVPLTGSGKGISVGNSLSSGMFGVHPKLVHRTERGSYRHQLS